jgi:NifU-like protein involved in Fe-S cluster formation
MAQCGCTDTRKTVYDYFRHACCRVSRAPIGSSGALVHGDDGASAQFVLEVIGARITGASYACSSCVTLIALCEHLAELAAGKAMEDARRLEPAALLRMHPEIPPSKQDRALLAVAALRAALEKPGRPGTCSTEELKT